MESTMSLNPLFRLAVLSGAMDAVEMHIRRGEDLNAKDGNGQTALMLGVSRGHFEMCRQLLRAGADITIRDNEGNDAISIAARYGWKNEVSQLRDYGKLTEEKWEANSPALQSLANSA